MNRKALILGSLVLVALALGACGGPAFECTDAIGCVDIEPGAPVKLAVLQVIAGELASLGEDQVRGVEIAIDDMDNDIHGHPVELVVEDEGCSAEGGTTAAQKVVADPQILGIVGTSCSGAGVPASQIMSEAGLVMISGSNTSPRLTSSPLGVTEGEAWQAGYFRTAHNDEVQGAGAANFMINDLEVTKIATIHDGDPYTEGLATVAGREFENFGGELVHATAINKGDTDMRPVLTAIAADGPELIYFPIFQPEGDFIVFQAKEISGLEDVILMGADGLLSDTYVESVGAEGVGTYYSGPETPSSAAYRDFLVKHSDKYGEDPIQSFHAHAYDAGRILLEAIQKVGVLDDDGTLHIGRQALRDALYETQAFAGITGNLTCDRFGDCAGQLVQVFRLDDPAAGISGLRNNAVFSCSAPCK